MEGTTWTVALVRWELARIAARADAATPYPWGEDPPRGLVNSHGKVIARVGASFALNAQDAANARFIANARYDVPALLATLAAERQRQAELRQVAAVIADANPTADDWTLAQIVVPYAMMLKARELVGK
jgi:hypothetical protein